MVKVLNLIMCSLESKENVVYGRIHKMTIAAMVHLYI